MIDSVDIKVDEDKFRLAVGSIDHRVNRELRAAIDDIADQVAHTARMNAPVQTGNLRAHGIDKQPTREGTVTDIFSFGGGRSVRGETGFVGSSDLPAGSKVFIASVRLDPSVKYGKWVHDGTGVYGPRHHPIVPITKQFLVFHWRGHKNVRKSVLGQRPNPFLTEAYVFVNNVYTPARMAVLRLALDV